METISPTRIDTLKYLIAHLPGNHSEVKEICLQLVDASEGLTKSVSAPNCPNTIADDMNKVGVYLSELMKLMGTNFCFSVHSTLPSLCTVIFSPKISI